MVAGWVADFRVCDAILGSALVTWPNWLEYAVAFVLLALFVRLTGWVLGQLTGWPARLGGLCVLAEWCLALAFWIGLLFLLAAGQQLRPVTFWGAVGLVVLAAAGLAIKRFRRDGRLKTELPGTSSGQPWKPWHLLIALLPLCLVLPCFFVDILPWVAWDADVYHLTVPKLYLAQGGFRPIALNVYSNWPLNVELLFAGAMLAKDYVLATLMHFGFGLLSLHALWVGCREAQRPAAAWLALPLFLANPVIFAEMSRANIDLAYVFFFLAGLLFVLRALQHGDDRHVALFLAGLCGGLLAGVKVNGCVGSALLGGLFLVQLPFRPRGTRWAELRALLRWFVLPVLVLSIPWLIKAAWFTGNPVYPFLYGWLGGSDWNAALGAQFQGWQQAMGMGRGVVDYLLLPLRVILKGGAGYDHFDGQLAPLWIVVLPVAVFFGLGDRFTRRCLGVAGAYFLVWSFSSQQMRLLTPALGPLALAAAVTVLRLLERLPRMITHRVALPLLTLGGVALLVWGNWGHFRGAYDLAGPYRTYPRSWWESRRDPVYAFIREQLPRTARLLLLNTNRGFFIDREYLADSFPEASQIAAWLQPARTATDLRSSLAERGITHVLMLKGDWPNPYHAVLLEALDTGRQLRLVFQSDSFVLFELRQ